MNSKLAQSVFETDQLQSLVSGFKAPQAARSAMHAAFELLSRLVRSVMDSWVLDGLVCSRKQAANTAMWPNL